MTASLSRMDTAQAERYTIDALSRVVGMSPRNIRAHQARGLLPAPARQGRTAYYTAAHVRRLESIKVLQRQGFNLVAIEAMLGVRQPAGEVEEPLTALLTRLVTERPALIAPLLRHGILQRRDDGTLHVARARAVQPALDLRHAAVPVPVALALLGEVLDRLGPLVDDVLRGTAGRVVALRRPAGAALTWEQLDQETAALTRSLVALLSEAFRAVAENVGEATVAEFVGGPMSLELHVEDALTVDNG